MLADVTESAGLLTDMADDIGGVPYIEIAPQTRDSDSPCTLYCGSGDLSAEVQQEDLSAIKQEFDEVEYIASLANDADHSSTVEYIEIAPLANNADQSSTTLDHSGDWPAEVKQEILSAVKQEPGVLQVCCT